MSPEKDQEFTELSAYVSLFATVVWRIPESATHHPSRQMKVIPGKVSKSQLLTGLRQAANDTIEASQDFTPEQVAAFDAECRNKNTITLSEVRRRYWTKYKAIIKRGYIRTHTEYYLAVGLVNDAGVAINSSEQQMLQGLVSAFELRQAQPSVPPDVPAAASRRQGRG